MITLKYKDIMSNNFLTGMKKIANYAGFPTSRELYHCGKLIDKLDKELKIAFTSLDKIKLEFAATAPVAAKEEASEETKKAAQEAQVAHRKVVEEKLNEFGETAITLDREQVKLSSLAKLSPGLTPSEVTALEAVLDFSDIEEGVVAGAGNGAGTKAASVAGPQAIQ